MNSLGVGVVRTIKLAFHNGCNVHFIDIYNRRASRQYSWYKYTRQIHVKHYGPWPGFPHDNHNRKKYSYSQPGIFIYFASIRSVSVVKYYICIAFYAVLLCVFTFWVPCCDVRCVFRIKSMVGSSLPPVVCRRVHVLFTFFCVFAYSCVQHILHCIFVLLFLVLCTLSCRFLWTIPLLYKINTYMKKNVQMHSEVLKNA